jgi:zinc transporter, ZIP family
VDVSVLLVFGVALVTALATGLGAIPLAFMRHAVPGVLGAANAVAAGVMLAASMGLAIEGGRVGLGRLGLGLAAGLVFILIVEQVLDHEPQLGLGTLRGEDARRALLIVVVMTVHSLAEGVGVGAAFGGGATLGLLIGIAIAVHNIPEGLAISLVLVPRGSSVKAAAAWSVFTSLPQPLLAVPAFLFVEEFRAVLPVGLGFAAGAMIWMVARDLVPDALRHSSRSVVLLAGGASFSAMALFQIVLLR